MIMLPLKIDFQVVIRMSKSYFPNFIIDMLHLLFYTEYCYRTNEIKDYYNFSGFLFSRHLFKITLWDQFWTCFLCDHTQATHLLHRSIHV